MQCARHFLLAFPLAVLSAASAGCVGRVGDVAPGSATPDVHSGRDPGTATPEVDPTVSTALACEGQTRDPGRVTIHRLNRAEYNNTVRDLIGTALRPADDFPSDDHGYGFDNIADVLSMSPLLAEKIQLATETLIAEVIATAFPGPTTARAEAETLGSDVGADYNGSAWNLFSDGTIVLPFTVTIAGRYEVGTMLFGQQAGPDPVQVELTIDNRSLGIFAVPETETSPRVLTVAADLMPGAHVFGVTFTNDYYVAPEDRNLIVDWIQWVGPTNYQAPPINAEARARVMVCDPIAIGQETCARRVLNRFARRAWRRPIAQEEEDRLYALAGVAFAEGESFDSALGISLQAILLSSNFLFRVEIDRDPTALTPHSLSPHELASRLSYFLWSSMPDDELSAHADDGSISDPSILRDQVARMLGDSRAEALVDNFAGQWLTTRRIADVSPDPLIYPDFDDDLRAAMEAETKTFFRAFIKEPASALDILDANFTFLNDRLAAHYGLSPVGSDNLTRVDLPDGPRRGLLTQGSILTVTARPRRTAPVIRGKWILEQLLCTTPPPPPPNVPSFPENASSGTIRERLARHRADPACAACHNAMDPLGLALENFDGIGAYRTEDGGEVIDATGQLPDGRSFDGSRELRAIIKADPKTPACFTERVFVYALGRGPEPYDSCTLGDITEEFRAGGHTFQSLFTALVGSPAFTSRRGEPLE